VDVVGDAVAVAVAAVVGGDELDGAVGVVVPGPAGAAG
jgi:hypothetical protein